MRKRDLGKGWIRAVSAFCLCLAWCVVDNRAADKLEPEPEVILADVADAFRKHCVRVYITGKTHAGKTPSVGNFADDIRNERPTLLGGYWWDDRHVVIEDPGLQDHFIHSLEIGLPFSDQRFPAKVAGRFVKLQAVLLEVQPNAEGVMPQAAPMQFADGDLEETVVLGYLWEDGEWRIKADGGMGASAITDSGLETVELGASGVFCDDSGTILGLAFGDKAIIGQEPEYWCGRELSYTPLFSEEDREAATRTMKAKLDRGIIETRFRLRVKIEDDDDSSEWTIDIDDAAATAAEVRAAGMVVGDRHLLVPLALQADGIARIEEITLHPLDGREIKGKFVGAFRDYMAILIEAEAELDAAAAPEGFAMLNPLVLPATMFEPADGEDLRPEREYLQRWRVDYALGRRREVADYDRWQGTFRGYRGDTVVLTLTNEEDGSLAFDTTGRLVAVALSPRVLSRGNRSDIKRFANPGFRPVDTLSRRLHADAVFDPAMAPVPEEEGRRLIDFGIEYQSLDANTSRLFTAAEATRAGQIGLLVTYVYPDSPADKAGIREHDILLRLFLEGKSEPTELRDRSVGGYGSNLFAAEDLSSESMQQILSFMPPPWPQRDNALSMLLTTAGVGRQAIVEYAREGELLRASFETAYTDPDYRNARREKFPALGLSVKPITYEVARYYRRSDASGVIVSKVEEGGRSAVAGLHQYLLITNVNGTRVQGVDDFRRHMQAFEDGESKAVELTLEGFGKTRLVKIE